MAFRYGGALVRPKEEGTLVDPTEDTGIRYVQPRARRELAPGDVGAARGAPGSTNYNLQVQAWKRRMAAGTQAVPTWTTVRQGAAQKQAQTQNPVAAAWAQSPATRSEDEVAELRGMLQRGEITQEQYNLFMDNPNYRWSRFVQTVPQRNLFGIPRENLFTSSPA